ncbi:gamma-glutamyltransferase family protein [Oceaniglobus indicus]|uniref:gamma-glutamyltransferase family protein n=1 Tax=Oceaniglobus indicus TaxID=2047749 RepID=UPI000C17799A|nr:gamma-glutamyltransferase family protein [Oceaniglobus indicus]
MHDFFSYRRPSTYARHAMVATSHPLASAAGLEILAQGGNAVDAALAASAVQCVVEPPMTGIGGDCFVLYAPKNGPVRALNGSGRAPAGATLDALHAAGLTNEIPRTSPHAVTIPGAISAWCLLHESHGSLPLERLFLRAISYANEGYPVTPRLAQDWAEMADLLRKDASAAKLFLSNGTAPGPGAIHRQPLLGDRLREIATDGPRAFYEGPVAASMARYLRGIGGTQTEEDFFEARDQAFWTDPISARYRDVEIFECPPNGQGLCALMILRILDGFDLGPDTALADRIHLHAEATKLAYHHRDGLIGDPAHSPGLVDELLSDRTIETLRARIDPTRALPPALWSEPAHEDTVYISVVDAEGNAVSFINSLFHGFGSGRVDPDTGVVFNSRGSSFRMTSDHPNAIAPGKRPLNTIIPGIARKDGRVWMSFGVMGGDYQAAGQADLLSAIIDRNLDPQAAMDAPRTFAFQGELQIEPGISPALRADLTARGHALTVAPTPIGGSQAILIDPDSGILCGGSDSRKDGMAIGL